jgi:MoxR-like ATPase
VLARADVLRLRALVREVPASDEVVRRARADRARDAPDDELAGEAVRASVRFGASPRGGQALLLAAKALALLSGRLHVAPRDLDRLAAPALRHRLVLSWEGEGAGTSRDALVAEALRSATRVDARPAAGTPGAENSSGSVPAGNSTASARRSEEWMKAPVSLRSC